jgi:transcriptional regulator with XRE-family HTH domain
MVDLRPFQDHDAEILERFGSRSRAAKRPEEWWPDRVKLVQDQFPSVMGDEAWWSKALEDTDMLGRMLRDILQIDMNDPQKGGRRFEPRPESGEERLRQLRGLDYAHEPFIKMFEVLTSGQSRTHVARKTGISRSRVHRLLTGAEHPDRTDLEAIAKGYGKHPSFFREYRTDSIIRLLLARLEDMPEYTVHLYRKMTFK